jgi:S-methylmethionine-dependent homocysteine/selenocysteine methylase
MPGPLEAMLAQRSPLLLDGAMGTELQRRGIAVALPLWSARALTSAPAVVLEIHKDYLDAGADVITTNTFRTTRRTFQRANMPDRSLALTVLAAQLAKEARLAYTDRPALVAGSIGPLEDCYRPDLVPRDRELRAEHAELAYRLAATGVDFLLLETIGTIREAFAACEAAIRTGLEVVMSFLCRTDGSLYGGEILEDAVSVIEPLGPTAFSLNCASPHLLTEQLQKLSLLTRRPIAVYGNVGIPDGEHGSMMTCDVSPEEYATYAAGWFRAGAAIVGGCCGTTPDHIRRLFRERASHAS